MLVSAYEHGLGISVLLKKYVKNLYASMKCFLGPYLDLGLPVPPGASGDEKPPSIMVTGDPTGSMPADTHLFFECTSPCLLRPPPLSSAVFWHPVH